MVPIELQDRNKWDQNLLGLAQNTLATAIARRRSGPYQIKAAIMDCHMLENGPDWTQLFLLYQSLWHFEPTNVVALNQAVVIGELGQVEAALRQVEDLKDELSNYQPWYATYADLLRKTGRVTDAIPAYQEALERTTNRASRLFLKSQLQECCDLERAGG
jgi:RNA polymerase sigma-70 factor (ECF subfamily)